MDIFDSAIVICVSFLITCGWGLICPKCHSVQNMNLCGEDTEQCSEHQDVCIGTLRRWHISMGCSTSQKCQNAVTHNTTDCSGSKPFAPRDRCTVCCTGHDCIPKMKNIQQGLDKISDVIHCPVCHNEHDPTKCLDNFVPCDKTHHTCEVQKNNGVLSSKCYRNTTQCLNHHDNANRLNIPFCIGTTEKCSVCCSDHDCIDYAFGIATPPTMPPVTTGAHGTSATAGVHGTSATLTFSPPTTCQDQSLFPCHLAVGEACFDPDVSQEFCRLTCGVCQAPSTIAATVHVTTQQAITTTDTATKSTTTPTTAITHHNVTTHVNHDTTTRATTVATTTTTTTTTPKPTTVHQTDTAQPSMVTTTSVPISTTKDVGCPNGWTQFDGSCYKLNSTDRLTFSQAAAYCETDHAYLIEVETAKENDFMKDFMTDKLVDNGIWLGANDILFEGYYVWDKSGKPLDYTDWYPGEPNQTTGEEDCMSSWKFEGYQWGDHYCDKPDLAALCEKPVTRCP